MPPEDNIDAAATSSAESSQRATEAMNPQESAGRVIGRYRLVQKIGEGGMGEVWLAEQREPVRRRVALKLIKTGMNSREVVGRFESERQALALMDHPNIAKVLDAGTADGSPYFVMEYVAGIPITEFCDEHKLSTRERLELFMRVCEGVQHAHQKAIIHRDLKPSNILVAESDGRPVPKIIDFGVAKALSQKLTSDTMFTRVGAIIGTPEYMSPEQALSSGVDIDTRTDVYSLGIILYELLAGAPPLDPRKIAFDEFLRKLRHDDPPKPSTAISTHDPATTTDLARKRHTEPRMLAREVRGDLDSIALKALEKDRVRRYGTPSELAADIGRYLRHEPVVARPASTAYRLQKYVRRHRVGVAAGLVFFALLVTSVVMQAVQLRRTRQERDRAARITDFMTSMFKVSDPRQARGNTVTAREILDKASKDINTGLAKDPVLQADLMETMADVYGELGLYPRAESLLRSSIDIRNRVQGPNDVATLKATRLFDFVLEEEGKYPEAEKLIRTTLDTDRRVLGPEHKETLLAKRDLGLILNEEGRYPESEKLTREVVDVAKRKFGESDPLTRGAILNLAINFAYEGKYSDAEKSFREVLESDRNRLGPDHPSVLQDMSNLAACLDQENRYAEAEQIYREAIQMKRRVMGPENPDTLLTMGNLALVLAGEKRYPEAEQLFRQTLDLKRRALGPEHRSTLVTMGNLADVLTSEGQFPQAEQLLRETLAIERRTLGSDHYDFLIAEDGLGNLLAKEKRYAEAEAMLKGNFDARQRILGPMHPETANAAYDLACAFALHGKADEAFSNLQFAVEHGLSADRRGQIEKDDDLKSLRGDARFARLVEAARSKGAGSQSK